jgi:cholesterol transport system auxiliary component
MGLVGVKKSGLARGGQLLLAAALMFVLTGCGGTGVLGTLIGTGNNPTPTFDLTAPREFGRMARGRGLLAVDIPTALQILDTEKLVILPTPGEVAYLGDAQWVDRLPRLLQARIVQAFENSTRIRAVARTSDRVSADYLLVIDVRQFGMVAYEGPYAIVELSVKIVYQRGGRIAAGTVLGAKIKAPGTSGAQAAYALDLAFQQVAIDMVKWTSGRI